MYKHIVILLFFINISICQEIYPYVSPGFTLSFNENKSGLSLKNINISYDISIGCQMNIMHVKLGFGKQNLSSKDHSIRYYYLGGGALGDLNAPSWEDMGGDPVDEEDRNRWLQKKIPSLSYPLGTATIASNY